MTIAIVFTVAILTALFAIRAGGAFCLLADMFSRLAALSFAMAQTCKACDELIGYLWRSGKRIYSDAVVEIHTEVFGD